MKDKIREICTFHDKDGTSGYLLDEQRFAKIFEKLDKAHLAGKKEAIEEIKRYSTIKLKDLAREANPIDGYYIIYKDLLNYLKNL